MSNYESIIIYDFYKRNKTLPQVLERSSMKLLNLINLFPILKLSKYLYIYSLNFIINFRIFNSNFNITNSLNLTLTTFLTLKNIK